MDSCDRTQQCSKSIAIIVKNIKDKNKYKLFITATQMGERLKRRSSERVGSYFLSLCVVVEKDDLPEDLIAGIG